jgi:hypothetical protein
MRFPGKASVAGLSLSLIASTGWAAEVCARPPDLVALQIAALQQQLMVAALTCDDVSLYNRFVTTYQQELLTSDETLQTFFDRFGDQEGGSAYHSFKTKMANVYSGRSAADKKKFCTSARASFAPALKSEQVSLATFAMSQPSSVNEPYTNCGDTIAGGAMLARTPVAAPPPPPSNLLTAQNAAAQAKGAAPPAPDDKPLSAALQADKAPAPAPSTAGSAVAAAGANAPPSNTSVPPANRNTARDPYYQGYGTGYARERERQRAPEQSTADSAGSRNAPASGSVANSNRYQERNVRSASEAYRERLAQQRAARQRAAERPSVTYRDRYDARGYYWPADPYWQYCYTRYGVRMSCAEAAERYRADRYYYRAPYDPRSYPSR